MNISEHDHAFSTHTGTHCHDHVIPGGAATSHSLISHGNLGNHPDSHGNNFAIGPPGSHQSTVVDAHIDTHRHNWDSHSGRQTISHTDPHTFHGTHSAGVHVDLPGQHGNDSPYPVIHRSHGTHGHHEHNNQETHVVLPGEHGNNSPYPIIQRPSKPSPKSTADTHVDSPSSVIQRPHESHNIHVHLPGQDGNNSPFPVIHRPNAGSSPVDIHSKANTVSNPVNHGLLDHLGDKVHVYKPDHHSVNTSQPEVFDPHALETHNPHSDIHAHSGHAPHVPIVPNGGPPGYYHMSPVRSTGLHPLREPPYGPPFRRDFMPPAGFQPGQLGVVPFVPPPHLGLPPGFRRFGPGPPLHGGGWGYPRFRGRFGRGRRRRRLERMARRALVSTLVDAITNMLRG